MRDTDTPQTLIAALASPEVAASLTSAEAFLQQPTDLFALAFLMLEQTGAYRWLVNTPDGAFTWPPGARSAIAPDAASLDAHHARIRGTARAWRKLLNEPAGKVPKSLQVLQKAIELFLSTPVAILRRNPTDGGTPDEIEATWVALVRTAELVAVADEACAGLGLKSPPGGGAALNDQSIRLVNRGSASRFDENCVRVLPKMRTPQRGITARSLSHHLAVVRGEVDVRWTWPSIPAWDSVDKVDLKILLFPWPHQLERAAFRAAPSRPDFTFGGSGRFGWFDFAPGYRTSALVAALNEALDRLRTSGRKADLLVMPELSVTEEEFNLVAALAANAGCGGIIAGVRGPRRNSVIARYISQDKTPAAPGVALPAIDVIQHKHHRWCLDGTQIRDYALASHLNPRMEWWENIAVEPRQIHFTCASDWLTICHLICEDLVRQDPIAQVIRSVGPTLLIAHLLDGPQVSARWPGRFASVYADDPGCSVLTFTSLGSAELSRAPGYEEPQRIVGLWRDPVTGTVELEMKPGELGILLTVARSFREEFTLDGRSDRGSAGLVVLVDRSAV